LKKKQYFYKLPGILGGIL